MQTPWVLNGFYKHTQRQPLRDAMAIRESCRIFAKPPSGEQWSALQDAAQSLALPGTRLQLGECENTLFQPFGGLLMRFENVQRFAAIIVEEETPQSIVDAGIGGEMLMLSAVALGLGGVWVMGTYKRSQLRLNLNPGERVKSLIGLGVPQKPPVPPLTRKRKALAQLCTGGFDEANPLMVRMALAVQNAPSAMNLQPWRMAWQSPAEMSIQVAKNSALLDLGIGLSHALLTLEDATPVISLSDDGLCAHIALPL